MRPVVWLIGAAVLGAALYAAAMVWLHPRYIYPFGQERFETPAFRAVSLPVEGAPPLPVYVAEAGQGAPAILYFMGNAGALSLFRPMLDHHRAAGRSVVAMTYRGGGGTQGTPSEARLKADALALRDALPELLGHPPGAVVLHGYSLGTGLALHVAARRAVDGVILTAPYTRLCRLMAAASYLPACLLPVQRWESVSDAPAVTAPVLVLHGSDDRLIPPAMGAALTDALLAGGTEAAFLSVPGAGHSDLMDFPAYLQAIDGFVDGLLR